jgi:hypothetical protein
MSQICVYASEVAALVGLNPFQDPEEAIAKLKKRHGLVLGLTEADKDCHGAALACTSPRAAMRQMSSGASKKVRESVALEVSERKAKAASDIVASTPALAVAIANGDLAATEACASEIEDPVTRKEAKRRCMVTSGQKTEGACLRRFEQQEARPVTSHQQSFRRSMVTTNGTQWVLFGRVDGISNGAVVETKSRQRKLMGVVPSYERPQLMAYMFLSRCEKALQNEDFRGQRKVHEVDFDALEWGTISESLCGIVDRISDEAKS